MPSPLALAKSTAPSRLAAATAKIQRIKAQVDKGKEATTMVLKNIVNQGETGASAFLGGFADQKWGVDDGSGIRQHVTSGMPTAALVAAGLDIVAGFGGFGEYQRDAFALATGALTSFTNTAGRKLAVKLDARMAERANARQVSAPAQAPQMSPPPAAAVSNGAAVAVVAGQ